MLHGGLDAVENQLLLTRPGRRSVDTHSSGFLAVLKSIFILLARSVKVYTSKSESAVSQ